MSHTGIASAAWFSRRKQKKIPDHSVTIPVTGPFSAKNPNITEIEMEMTGWLYENMNPSQVDSIFWEISSYMFFIAYFVDPKDAMVFKLRWAQ